ncbi:hypothetical protein AU210_016432 [Fusarium oxysporum f. sp. radicis-cucumerinum]|uniref:Uncharacterized protein n=1 Tax=Fusarium oxysporum f. sp. radicis-cucumerinum TaxID=327505 RepID=A0A2H3FT23_FUSOX|nr:hypothetical protein AU210_016432 [Fusarium oxysporum f. sp. radicis-cucumerinum]
MTVTEEDKSSTSAPAPLEVPSVAHYPCYYDPDILQPHTAPDPSTPVPLLPTAILEPNKAPHNSQFISSLTSEVVWDTTPMTVPTSVGSLLEWDKSPTTPITTPSATPTPSLSSQSAPNSILLACALIGFVSTFFL